MKNVSLTENEYALLQRYRALNLSRRAMLEGMAHDMAKAQGAERRADGTADDSFRYQDAELVARYQKLPQNLKQCVEAIFHIGDIYARQAERNNEKIIT